MSLHTRIERDTVAEVILLVDILPRLKISLLSPFVQRRNATTSSDLERIVSGLQAAQATSHINMESLYAISAHTQAAPVTTVAVSSIKRYKKRAAEPVSALFGAEVRSYDLTARSQQQAVASTSAAAASSSSLAKSPLAARILAGGRSSPAGIATPAAFTSRDSSLLINRAPRGRPRTRETSRRCLTSALCLQAPKTLMAQPVAPSHAPPSPVDPR